MMLKPLDTTKENNKGIIQNDFDLLAHNLKNSARNKVFHR